LVDEGYGFTATAETMPSAEHAVRSFSHQLEVASGTRLVDVYLRDEALKQTVRALPAGWLLFDHQRRGLFREAMRGLLPESLRTRPDKALFEPALIRLLDAMGGHACLARLARAEHLASLGLVEPNAFAQAFEVFVRNSSDPAGWTDLWPALGVEAFLQSRAARRAS
jgi:hypothetical protein